MNHTRLFGTDGIRAPFGRFPLDRSTVLSLARQLAGMLTEVQGDSHVILGGDTRQSTVEICDWLNQGLQQGGASTVYTGVIPTPGIAFLARHRRAAAGISVSASHNPHPDNGIKLIDGNGGKWSVEAEAELEKHLAASSTPGAETSGGPPEIDASAADEYCAYLIESLPGTRPLAGLRIALDAANGAASPFARPVFEALGAEVESIYDRPDGTNINAGCGSTHPQALAALTSSAGCDLGIAFDGDADRAVLVDERGNLQDGDTILYLWATDLQEQGRLQPSRIVATTMSNLGLEKALARRKIDLVRCDVGDRLVVEAMQREGILLGGEQSGHIVHLDLSRTGDGLLTALHMAYLVQRSGRPLSQLAKDLVRYPQILRNVPVSRKQDFETLPELGQALIAAHETLGDEGRLLLRYSGTEPLARIMIEGRDPEQIQNLADDLARHIARELGES